jgi:hypothetical protein
VRTRLTAAITAALFLSTSLAIAPLSAGASDLAAPTATISFDCSAQFGLTITATNPNDTDTTLDFGYGADDNGDPTAGDDGQALPADQTTVFSDFIGFSGATRVRVFWNSITIADAVVGDCSVPPVTTPPVTTPPVTTPPVADPVASPVYRFWSPTLHAHFYTIDAAEKAHIVATYPARVWTYEGIGFAGFTSQATGTIPLYRFWSNRLGDHFYTTSASERDSIIATYDTNTWQYEGVAYYVYPQSSTVAGTVSVARFWSPELQTHFYTADDSERDSIIRTYPRRTWTYEDQEFKVPYIAPELVPPVVVTPPVVTPPASGPLPLPSSHVNCSNFSTYQQALAWYRFYRVPYGDIAGLDADNDGKPCETLPGHP